MNVLLKKQDPISDWSSHVSSLRFFMCCPFLCGLYSPDLRKKSEWGTFLLSNGDCYTSPGLPWWCWGLYRAWLCAMLSTKDPEGLPGALWGVLLRVCIWWLLGVLGVRPLGDEPHAGMFCSSIPSRVKSQSSGSSSERNKNKRRKKHKSPCGPPVGIYSASQNLLNMGPCCWDGFQ